MKRERSENNNAAQPETGKGHKFKLTWNFIFRFYDAYSRSKNMAKVAACLGTSAANLERRIEKYPPLRKAQEAADEYRPAQTLSAYSFSQLSEKGKRVWKELQTANSAEGIQALFAGENKKLRQELFIYALANTAYDLSSACRMVGIDRSLLGKWKHDLEFIQLLEEIQWHKKNFFETSFISLAEERHPGAIIFGNKTLNADRGYSEKLQLEHKGGIGGGGIDIEELDLDLATRKKILEAVRFQKARKMDQSQEMAIAVFKPKGSYSENGEKADGY